MIEAWFFADPAALVAAGAPAGTRFVSGTRDPEAFLTGDPAYLIDTEASCPCWVAKGREKSFRPKWLGKHPRELHPKGYLQWLCRNGAARNCTSYDETANGGRALSMVDWALLLGRPDGQVQYLRALVADLADALQQPPVTGPIQETQASVTSRFTFRPKPVLRNL